MPTITARWVFPVSGPPLAGGVVSVEQGRIVAVQPHSPADVDLGESALLPAFVNAHCHLDLTGMAGLAPPSPDFAAWLRRVIAHRRTRSPEQVADDIRAGIALLLAAGTGLVADISGDGSSFPLLAASPLRAVVFREALGLPPQRAAAAAGMLQEWAGLPGTERCRRGASPHAPYSCHADVYRAAARTGLPVATHLAETREELRLLADRQGPFVGFLQDLGAWHPDGLVAGPEDVVALLGTRVPVLLAHGNHLDGIALPSNCTIVYCPRTHAAFGHPPHPLPAGARIALGTDGLASNPDLGILGEARFLHGTGRLDPALILRMATLHGAEALDEPCGSLEPGKRADLVAVRLGPGRDPHERLLGGDGPVERLWLDGAAVT